MKHIKKTLRQTKKIGKSAAKTVAHYGKEIAHEAKDRLAAELKNIIEDRIITRDEAQQLMNSITNELRQEKNRVLAFAKQEIDRELKKAKPLVKKAVKRMHKGKHHHGHGVKKRKK